MVVSQHAKFQLMTMTGSRFFWTFFVEILQPPLPALVPKAGLRISRSDVRGSPQTKSGFIRLLATGNVTVVEGQFRANCLLYGLEVFVAAAVMNGITCVVQCYNKIQPPTWYFTSTKPCEWTRNGKMVNVRTHTQCNFQQVSPEGCSCRRIPEVDYSIVHSNYMERKIRKK